MSYSKNGLWKFTILEKQTAKENGICLSTLRSRMNVYGWNIERAITTPPGRLFGKVASGFTDEEFKLAKEYGISRNLLITRVKSLKWDKELAMTTPPHKTGEKYNKYGSKDNIEARG